MSSGEMNISHASNVRSVTGFNPLMPSFNRVISILELLNFILRELSLSDLLHFATTCQAICQPTLDKIWENQTSLIPLINTIPNSRGFKARLLGTVEGPVELGFSTTG